MKSAEYEKPRNSSCMTCVSTIKDGVSIPVHFQGDLSVGIQGKSKLTRLYGCKDGRYAREFRVEVGCVCWRGNLREERSWDTLVVDVVPVDVSKECMGHN